MIRSAFFLAYAITIPPLLVCIVAIAYLVLCVIEPDGD